jgi:fermentation-respiration switch protein FrsA (DUF1100 family)
MSTTLPPPITRRHWQTIGWRIIRITLLSYLGILLVLLFFENWLVYPLSTAADFWQQPPSADWEDLYLEIEGGTKIHTWWCPGPAPVNGVLLYCHGNGGNLSHRARTIQGIHQQLGVSVLIFDYPGYGKSEGSPSEAGCYAAAEAAYRWLIENKQIRAEDVLLFGNSLGGGVATHLGAKYPHRALILSKTFTSIVDVGQGQFPLLPVRWLMSNRFDSLSRIKDCKSPVFITHGKMDEMIPFRHAETLFAAANEPKYLLPVETGDHNAPLNEEFFDRLKAFLADTKQSRPLLLKEGTDEW